jgi:hypothetical protein
VPDCSLPLNSLPYFSYDMIKQLILNQLFTVLRSFRVELRPDPLVLAQGVNQSKIRSRTMRETSCLLHILEFWRNEIVMGSPIGCPNRHSATRPNHFGNRHLSWGTHKSRTRGSV